MNKRLNEQLHCVCSKVVKFYDAVIVSKLAEFDLRTKEERVYCRGCRDGKKKTSEWLSGRLSSGGLGAQPRYTEG